MTVAPRWRKVLGDISVAPFRSLLAVLAMAAGVFGLAAILTSYAILGRELAATYAGTHPASAILTADAVSDATIDLARGVHGVLDAEARPVIRGRIRVGDDDWVPLLIFVIRDFDHLRMDRFVRDAGTWPPGADEMLLERTALSVAQAGIGDRVTMKVTGGVDRTLRIAGTVHAAGLAPAWMEHAVYGFVGWTSVVRADTSAETPQLRLVVDAKDEAGIREVAGRVAGALEADGLSISRISVPPPGRHPHADQMDTFLFLLGAFGALTLALGAVLVANMMHALLIEQVRQIGSMKAVGATTRQVAALYLVEVSMLAAISLCISLPLGVWAGRGYVEFAATILNATIVSDAVPGWVLALEVTIGLGVPLVVAVGPVYRASRISIHEAFSTPDLALAPGRRLFGTSRFDRWLVTTRWLPRSLMLRLSLRTTFQRRGRLALTLGTLAAGGVVFMSALNVSGAWSRAIAKDAGFHPYDVEVRLAQPTPIAAFADAIAALPDVARAEYWAEADAVLVRPGGQADTARPSISLPHGGAIDGARVTLIGPDRDTRLLDLPMLDGRWLRPDDQDAVVISPTLLAADPALHVGGEIALRVGDRTVSWPIVGVARELFPSAVGYAPARAIREAAGEPDGLARTLRVQTRGHDAAAQLSAAQALERTLARLGVTVSGTRRLLDTRQSFEDHLVIIVSALLLAAGLVVLVGALGLTSTLTVNVIERTREIGVLGAIGAGPRTIARQVLVEGLIIAVSSWAVALFVAAPVTWALCVVTGRIFIRTPIDFFMSPGAAAIWLALVVVLAVLGSFFPARRAARLTVREALAYA